jgi:UDP-N-acetylglucosamine 2-epimerase (non-hydrolysing)
MKIMTVVGTRPEVIRLSRIIDLLDRHVEHVLVHTNQNYDDRLNGLFFRELGIRAPDMTLDVRGDRFGAQVAQILDRGEAALLAHRPDRLLVLGDTNSGLLSIVARRLGIPVFHMEAGNRCHDDRVPEEVNRRLIDHASTVLMPYTNRSRDNLIREGIDSRRIFVTGNPINQVIESYGEPIAASQALRQLDVREREYFLVTMHRAENVDRPDKLEDVIEALCRLQAEYRYPVVCSIHPRTRSRLNALRTSRASSLRLLEPLGFFDFVRLEQSAFCVLSDSGTVQEEACIFGVPNVTIREVTERPETLECGSNLLAGTNPDAIVNAVRLVTRTPHTWQPPPEYVASQVAETVCRMTTGYFVADSAEVEWQTGARV